MSATERARPHEVEGVLVADSRGERRSRGTREGTEPERRLLFKAPGAHVEVSLPIGPCREPAWLQGQFVATDRAGPGASRVHVTLVPDAGEKRTTVADETGEFSIACNPSTSFWLECRTAAGDLVRVRCEA